MTKYQLKLLKEIATVHLGNFQSGLEEEPKDVLMAIEGDQDEIERVTLNVLSHVHEQESVDSEFVGTIKHLIAEIASKYYREDDEIRKLLMYQLDFFVVSCAQNPGPTEDYESGLKFNWEIRFDKHCFSDMVNEIDQLLLWKLLNRSFAKVRASGFGFKSSFNLDENLRYSAGHNQFILVCPETFRIQTNKTGIASTFGRLSLVVKLIYGLGCRLGKTRVVLNAGETYKQIELDQVDQESLLRTSGGEMSDSTLLIRYWPVLSGKIETADTSVENVLARVRDIDIHRYPEDNVVDLMTCFEMLFADSVEIRFKLACRVAAFLGVAGMPGAFSTIFQAYKDRSELVHGSAKSAKEGAERLWGTIPLIETYLRASIIGRLFYPQNKVAFLAQLDLLLKDLIDPADTTEADKVAILGFKQRLSILQKLESLVQEPQF